MLRFVGLSVVVGGIFCALILPSTIHASSTGPVIYQVQVGATGITNKEFISVYNNSNFPVNVTNWCLKYGLNTDTASLGCLNPPDINTKLWLPSHSYLISASTAFRADFPTSTIFDLNFSSGTIAAKDRYVRLIDASGTEIDRVGWGIGGAETTPASNPISPNMLQRLNIDTITLKDTDNNFSDFTQLLVTTVPVSGVYEEIILVDTCSNIDGLQTELPAGYLQDEAGNCQLDVCSNIDGLQIVIPSSYESIDGLTCTLIPPPPPEDATLLITELLPNAASNDTGNEFIEVFNPNNQSVNLKDYKLELGPSFSKSYIFSEQTIEPRNYLIFSDTLTGIVLPNTTAFLRLTAPAGNVVSTTDIYDTPADNMAWALFENIWEYTNQPTPGSANLTSLLEPGLGGGEEEGSAGLVLCPAGKFRNPETNRCKNIEDSENSLTPCTADQIRSSETNRCRSIFSSSSSLTPCQPGQTRNPETNRCRSAAAAASASLKPCPANQERNPETNRCRKKASSVAAGKIKDIEAEQIGGGQNGWMLAGGVVAVAAGYGAWEWRTEMMNGVRRFRQMFSKTPID